VLAHYDFLFGNFAILVIFDENAQCGVRRRPQCVIYVITHTAVDEDPNPFLVISIFVNLIYLTIKHLTKWH